MFFDRNNFLFKDCFQIQIKDIRSASDKTWGETRKVGDENWNLQGKMVMRVGRHPYVSTARAH